MRHSFLFMRLFSVVILMILMTALCTTLIYTAIASNLFTTIKENELLPRAKSLGNFLTQDQDLLGILQTVDDSGAMIGADVVVTDRNGAVRYADKSLRNEYLAGLDEATLSVMEAGELRTDQMPALRRTNMVGVGAPVYANGVPDGAVFLLVPMYEALIAMGSLNSALIISLSMSLPVVAALVYYVVRRIVWPLRQMRDVAINMASGNFMARADTSQRGEIGQLASSLNSLSQELFSTISALVLEKNRLQQTLDGLREGIVAIDSTGRITNHNPAVATLFAAVSPRGDASAKMRIVPDAQVWRDYQTVIESGEPVLRILPLPDRVLQVSIVPLRDADTTAIAGAVGLFSDVTESERLERTRRDYVANVSHEMRTPLTAMRALLEPLTEGMVKDEAARERYYGIMMRETMRLSRLIDDLMELSRLQSGTLTIREEPVSVRDVAADLADKYEAVAAEHGLTFETAVPADCPEALVNEDRLEQLLIILIDNAIKYTPEGGRVALRARWDDRQIELEVADTGIGIDPKDQPYVFDRFYKVDQSHSGLGSGLGLSIASELARVMDARVALSSEVGKGSTFTLIVKRKR